MDRINIKGTVAPGFESVKSLFEKRIRELWEDNAQLCVYVGEEKVVDLAASNSDKFSADSIICLTWYLAMSYRIFFNVLSFDLISD